MDETSEMTQYKEVCKPQFEALFANMARKDEQSKIGQTVDLIYSKLFEGNGQKSFATRLALLEQANDAGKETAKDTKESKHTLRNWLLGIAASIIFLLFQTLFFDWLATRNHLAQPTETKQAGK